MRAAPFTIRDCDINEESTRDKVCRVPQDAEDDGFACPASPGAHCQPVLFMGSVDATGDPKCHCIFTCPQPFYRNVRSSGICTATNVVGGFPCPPETQAAPPGKGFCQGRLGMECYFKVFAPGFCPPSFPVAKPWLLKQATCMLPGV
jgi:hypothetical protein